MDLAGLFPDDADVDDVSDDDSEAEEKRAQIKARRSLKSLFVCAAANTAAEGTPDADRPPPITAETLTDPRTNLSGEQMTAVLKERGLPPKPPNEDHPRTVARLCAADQKLTAPELHALMKRYFIKIKGSREAKLQALAEEEARRFRTE